MEVTEVEEEEPSKTEEDNSSKIVDSEKDRQVTSSVEQIHRQTSDNVVDTRGSRRLRDIEIEPHYLTSSRIMLKNHLDRFNTNSDNKSDSGLRLANRLSQDYSNPDIRLADPTSLPVHKSYTSLRSARANIDDVISSSSTSKHYSSTTIDPVNLPNDI